jgi:hypothetical protein
MTRFSALMASIVLAATACGGGGGTNTGDATLEALRDGCESGTMSMCDVLFMSAPVDSALEAFGDTCGGRNPAEGWCVGVYDMEVDLAQLWGLCGAGEMFACDLLYMYSPFGSAEEAMGASCAGRGKTAVTCVMEYGMP